MISLSLKFRIKNGNEQNFKCIFLVFESSQGLVKDSSLFFTSKL